MPSQEAPAVNRQPIKEGTHAAALAKRSTSPCEYQRCLVTDEKDDGAEEPRTKPTLSIPKTGVRVKKRGKMGLPGSTGTSRKG
jgi:hypothetical protein